ncbi:helix-turn-helix domain-containing protein [Auritidibacter ignavus]|uniref:helix-turn-helix domain-containing protein n=1 Tax=Auritidibacter ignavus TaxID=678932 RepID=UPI000F02E576|nr:helix-turn-helix transcriptional regulator [Auritidibacter ignavus]NIH70503.1 transcriptional regulator with XRE-family HTH domain [Auritidibacter ignavus]RMX23308.1 XRE family transcriptional regulator [Auritidibacter ignavus]
MNITTERAIAKKIQQLRLTRGWTYQALADRMKEIGHPIDPSGIHKTEKAGRRITVNELIGYTRAFDIRVTQLLGEPETPQEIAKHQNHKNRERLRHIAETAQHLYTQALQDATGEQP